MIKLNNKEIAEFYHTSYTRVDGLWFMKAEEKYGFDAALEIDTEVWKIMPKIQARILKSSSRLAIKDGIDALLHCFTTKLTLDGFAYKIKEITGNSGFRVIVEKCPWYELMVKSGRDAISGKVGTSICNAEYSAWASEFGNKIHFELKEQICKGAKNCILVFRC